MNDEAYRAVQRYIRDRRRPAEAIAISLAVAAIGAVAIVLGLAWLRDEERATRAIVVERCGR